MNEALRPDGEQSPAGPAATGPGPAGDPGRPVLTVVDCDDVTLADPGVSSSVAGRFFLSAPPKDPSADRLPGDAIENTEPTGKHPKAGSDEATEVEGGLADQLACPVPRPRDLTASLELPAAVHARSHATWDASEVVTEVYAAYYGQLIRLALLLVHDVQTAEEVVQDAFESMHLAWRRLRDAEKALSYLRQSVVNRSRSVLRHRKVAEMHAPVSAPDEESAEESALALLDRSAVSSAIRSLPSRQREALVLRYYMDLSEADIAVAMGISRGAVKSHTARAMAALKSILEQEV